MLNDLLFLKPAIPNKPLSEVFSHIRIENGVALACDGQMAMCCPVDTDIVATPRGDELLAALKSAGDTFQMSLLENGNIVVKAGKFKATVRCSTDEYPALPVGGLCIELPPMIEAMRIAKKYTYANNLHKWTHSIFLRKQSLFATTGATIIENWLQSDSGIMAEIPLDVVDAMIRIGKEPDYAEVADNWIRFHYGKSWLWFSRPTDLWPREVESYMGKGWEKEFQDIPTGLYDHLDSIKSFVTAQDSVFWLKNGTFMTSECETEGASVEVDGVICNLNLQISFPALSGIEPVATSIRFDHPIKFIGNNLRGTVYAKIV